MNLYDILALLKKATFDLEKILYDDYKFNDLHFTTPNKIIELVNKEFNADCTAPVKTKTITECRHAAFYLLAKYTKLSHRERSMALGLSHHTTSMHSIKKCQDLMQIDQYYKHKVNNIESNLNKLLKRD